MDQSTLINDTDLRSQRDAMIDVVTITQQDAIDTIETSQHAVIEGMTSVRTELTEFVSERIKSDLETQKAMMQCKSFNDLCRVQTNYFKTAMDQYSTETTRILQMGSALVSRTIDRRTF